MSITSPLKTNNDPLKEIKMVKTDPKKVPSQIFFLLVPLGTKLFTKKDFPLHNPFKGKTKNLLGHPNNKKNIYYISLSGGNN